jgi:hypothetical protein
MPTLFPPIYPVQAKFDGHDFVSTGIDYADSMHVIKGHKPGASRRLETPEWAYNDGQLRAVVVRFLELRANFRKQQHGTEAERLQRAIAKLQTTKPHLEELLNRFCRKYADNKKAGVDSVILKRQALEIKMFDTQLCWLGREHLLALGVIHHYYRCGADSVATGAALGIQPPHVRSILWRLNKAAARPYIKPVHISMHINLLRGLKFNPVQVVGARQHQCWMCGKIFTPTDSHERHCSKKCRVERKKARDKKRIGKRGGCGYRHWFCSPECKAAGIHIKKIMIAFKPGIGKFVAPPGGTPYDSYAQYCRVVGVVPMSLAAWNSGGVLEYAPRILIKHNKK